MPYITTEQVKKMRKQIKEKFPAFTFSITRDRHSTIAVAILSGPLIFDTERNYHQVNHYYIKDHYDGEAAKMLSNLYAIMDQDNGTLVEDGDYGRVPLYYTSISIGAWDKPYRLLLPDQQGNPVAMLKIKSLKAA